MALVAGTPSIDAALHLRDRLGIEADSVPGSHCAYLSRPGAVAEAVLRCWSETAV